MDMTSVTALSGVLGTLVGVSATGAVAWINQKTLHRRELVRDDMRMRQELYGEFLAECARLLVDAFQHSLEKPETFVPVYGADQSDPALRDKACADRSRTARRAHYRPILLEQFDRAGGAPAHAFR